MRTLELTQGKVALVDDADFEMVNQFKWHARKKRQCFYAVHNFLKSRGGRTPVYLHQFLMPAITSVDHRDGDGLNNQRSNLRPATSQQNRQAFQRKQKGVSSQFRGVSWHRQTQKWQVHIKVNEKRLYLGLFLSERDAARAYDESAREHFGEFASPNFSKLQHL